jgi:hypothetical protein
MQLRLPKPGSILIGALVLLALGAGFAVGMPYFHVIRASAEVARLGGRVETRRIGPGWVHRLGTFLH